MKWGRIHVCLTLRLTPRLLCDTMCLLFVKHQRSDGLHKRLSSLFVDSTLNSSSSINRTITSHVILTTGARLGTL